MSHLITAKTKVSRKDILEGTLKELGYSYSAQGDKITINGHKAYGNDITFDTKAGTVDSDHMGVHQQIVQKVNQHYVKNDYVDQMNQAGHKVQEVQMDNEGNFKIRVRA